MRETRRSGALILVCLLLQFTRDTIALQPGTIKVPDGTLVRLALLDNLSSATNNADDAVNFELTEDVKVGEIVAIPKGSTARGHIVEVQPRRRMGRAGKLNFSVDYVKALDGSNVRLRASSARQGEDKSGTVIVGTVLLGGLFLIMRGKDVNIPKGTAFNAYVDGDREVAVAGAAPVAAQPATTAASAAPAPAAQPAPAPSTEDLTTAVLKSDPPGADVTVDGKYMGSTPSTVRLAPGDHTVLFEKAGYRAWQRTMTVNPGGIVTIDTALEKLP
ncbi:MAG: PEGA domain-containing protein [Acidobacteriia bacterium]|nr:PEGA domain-containing protein [Terriglobia bacterium]